jgi:SAM-dependent methyltransferase
VTKPVKGYLAPIARDYEEILAAHGATPPGVGMHNEREHRLRFEKLTTLIEGPDGGSIADLGCGYGALYDYLRERRLRVDRFIGYDISERMLAEARRRVPEGEFILADTLDREVDFAFAGGIFNVRMQIDEAEWLQHIDDTLDNMNAFTSRGFAFDLLSSYVDYRNPLLYYGDACRFFDRCKRRYSRKVALLHDYPLYEWTMIVRK